MNPPTLRVTVNARLKGIMTIYDKKIDKKIDKEIDKEIDFKTELSLRLGRGLLQGIRLHRAQYLAGVFFRKRGKDWTFTLRFPSDAQWTTHFVDELVRFE